MPSTNMRITRVKPGSSRLRTLHVLRRQRMGPHFARVTLGGEDLHDFVPLGYDQWFRLFLPVAGGTLDRVPNKLDMVSYLRFLTVARAERPVLRSYSVRSFRPGGIDGTDGPELDIDFVLHGCVDDGTAGPATAWALTCRTGDAVGILDEGTGFALPEGIDHLRIVAEETGLPATANILASLPEGVTAEVVLEIPEDADRQELAQREGIDITWLTRPDHDTVPGTLALAAARELPTPDRPWFGFTVGEHSLATGVRRHWVEQGQPKDRLMFCGYWRAPRR